MVCSTPLIILRKVLVQELQQISHNGLLCHFSNKCIPVHMFARIQFHLQEVHVGREQTGTEGRGSGIDWTRNGRLWAHPRLDWSCLWRFDRRVGSLP